MRKYFEILGLDPSASIEDLEDAYEELAKVWRPESYRNLPRFRRKAAVKLKEINNAYEHLKTFLLAKHAESEADQKTGCADINCAGYINPDGVCDRCGKPAGGQPAEPELAAVLPEQTRPPVSRKIPHRRKLVVAGIVIVAFLGVLVRYQVSNNKKPDAQIAQSPAVEQAQPAADAPSQKSLPESLQVKPDAEIVSDLTPEKPLPPAESDRSNEPVSTQRQIAGPEFTVDYQELFTRKALRKYNLGRNRIKRIQRSLIANGYKTGPVDGVIGPQTIGALRQFAGDRAIENNDILGSDITRAVLIYVEISALHPDWQTIFGSEDFRRWMNRQSYVSASQIKQSATAQQVNEILNAYKFDKEKPRPLSLPPTGVIQKRFARGQVSIQIIARPQNTSYFVKLINAFTRQEIMTAFVRENTELAVDIPAGKYELQYATGKKWFGSRYLFGPATRHSPSYQLVEIKKTGHPMAVNTLRLILHPDGKLQTQKISESDIHLF